MKQHIVILACLCSTALVLSAPAPQNNRQELDVFQIPLNDGRELDVYALGDSQQLNERNKRTIGILRDLFPEISKQIEDQVNALVAQLLRTLGPTVLRTAIQGNTANRNSAMDDDFDADFSDDDTIKSDDSDDTNGTRVKIELPTFTPDDDDDTSTKSSNNVSDNETKMNGGAESIDLSALNDHIEETIRVARQINSPSDNSLASAVNNQALDNDQQGSESKAPAIDELTLDSLEDADNEDRNKRQGLFGGGAGGSANGGSGNFLFDIIRLFSGSVQTPQNDQRSNDSTDEDGESKPADQNDGYTEGIPGPVTRLVVLANRGLANLVQDLILRVAATSERLVNFKARLITALI